MANKSREEGATPPFHNHQRALWKPSHTLKFWYDISIMESVEFIFIMAVVMSFIATVSGRNDTSWPKQQCDQNRGSREFDYFVLALEWPGTVCKNTKHCCATNACCHGISSSLHFTIHGLWPDYNDGSWPQCCSGPSFDENKIVSLLGELERDWPSLSCNSPTNCHGKRGSFWEHEWEKHGTCAYPVIRDEYSYFSTTLQLYSKYNILDILSAAGYSPDNGEEYPTHDLVAAISKAVGATPLLVCSQGEVMELRICFYKDFKPRDCVSGDTEQIKLYKSYCPEHVLLPQYLSSGGRQQMLLNLLHPLFVLYDKIQGH